MNLDLKVSSGSLLWIILDSSFRNWCSASIKCSTWIRFQKRKRKSFRYFSISLRVISQKSQIFNTWKLSHKKPSAAGVAEISVDWKLSFNISSRIVHRNILVLVRCISGIRRNRSVTTCSASTPVETTRIASRKQFNAKWIWRIRKQILSSTFWLTPCSVRGVWGTPWRHTSAPSASLWSTALSNVWTLTGPITSLPVEYLGGLRATSEPAGDWTTRAGRRGELTVWAFSLDWTLTLMRH